MFGQGLTVANMERLGYSNILQNCMENLLLAEKQLQDKNTVTGGHCFTTLVQFWKEIDNISKKLSFECTKLCISFSSLPLPSSNETSSLLKGIEEAVLALVSVTLKFDPCFGKALHVKLSSSTVSAVQTTRQLIRVIKDDGGDGVNERYRQATGIAWEGCKTLENCPKDNKEAVLYHLKDQNSMVSDAFEEITEELEGDGKGWDSFGSSSSDSEEESSWSEQDKLTMNPTVNIIKTAKILFDKIILAIDKNGSCEDSERVIELDQLLEDCTPISQTVDSLILELYPPLNVANMELQSQSLAIHLQAALKTASKSHVITEDEKSVVEFIQKAVEHNLNKMKEILRTV